MFFNTLNRMLFWEFLRVFLMSLFGITAIFMLFGFYQQASQMGLSPTQMLHILPLLIPPGLPYTIPTTMLFASCVVYGRLSADNEATAIKAAGIDLLTVLRPAICIGLFGTATTVILANTIIPQSFQLIQAEVMKDPDEFVYNMLRRERSFRGQTPFVVYVRDVQGRRLIDVIIKHKKTPPPKESEPLSVYEPVIRAKEAMLRVDLNDGPAGTVSFDPVGNWSIAGAKEGDSSESPGDTTPIKMSLPEQLFSQRHIKERPAALDWNELQDKLEVWRKDYDKLLTDREEVRRRAERETNIAEKRNLEAQDPHFDARLKFTARLIRIGEYEFYSRPAMAFGCLCFAMVGCPVGIWASRSDYLSTFVICFLPSLVVYFVPLLSARGLAYDGKIPTLVAVWFPNMLMGFAALILTYRLMKR